LLYSHLASSSLQCSQFTFREQVIDVSTSKTGKHGHAKCHFVAEDIFTGKRCDELVPAGHNLEIPVVSKAEYTLLDIDDDDHMSLMDEKGDTREDLKLPDDRSGDSAFALAQEVQKKFDEGAEVAVTIMSAMGIDQLSGWKEVAN
jgi:translation initiation factor 5A